MASTYTLTSNSYDGRYMQLVCTQTKNITANTSTISWTLSSIGGNSNYYSTGATTVTINGEQVYYKERVSHTSKVFPAAKGSVSGTLTVNHNTNGTKSIYVNFSTDIYYQNIKTYSGSWTLDSIPRAATLKSATDFTDVTNPSITYANPAGTGIDKIEAFIYSNDEKTVLMSAKVLDRGKTAATFTLDSTTLNNLYDASKNSNSIKVKYRLRTTAGTNTFWSESITKTFTVTDANPIAAITHNDNNAAMTALTGSSTKYVRYHSNMVYSIAATAQKKADIKSYLLTIGAQSGSTQSGTITAIDGTEYALTVTDSRGNTNTNRSAAIDCVPYINLTCEQKVKLELVGETGLTATLEVSGNYYSGSFGAVENNIRLYYRYKQQTGDFTDWKSFNTAPSVSNGTYTATTVATGLSYDKTYTFECAAFDAVFTDGVISASYTATFKPVFDWSRTDFNFNVPVNINGNLAVNGADLTTDFVVETGTEAMGSNGTWYWRKWASGKAECYGIRNYGNMGISTAWGNLYTSADFQQSLPTGLFVSVPVSNINIVKTDSGGCWISTQGASGGSATQTGKFIVCRPTSFTAQQVYIGFNCIGRWK